MADLRDNYAQAAARAAREHGRDQDARWRCDAVTIAALAVLARDLERNRGLRLLAPDDSDDRLAAGITVIYTDLAVRFPDLLPPSLTPPAPSLVRALTVPFRDVEIHEGPGFIDALDVAFCHAASTTGKEITRGAFFTPPAVADLTAAMLGVGDDRPWERPFYEPAVGTGAMLLAAWRDVRTAIRTAHDDGTLDYAQARQAVNTWATNVVAVDIDHEAAWTTAMQMAVRIGTVGTIFVGDSLDQSTWKPVSHPHAPSATSDLDRIAQLMRDIA